MTDRPSVAGAVLAGGASRRMGQDKALVEVGGLPMARRALDALLAAGANPVALVGGDRDALAGLGVETVPDRWPGAGPLAGVATALTSGFLAADLVVVVATDQPWLDPSTLRDLVDAVVADPRAVGAVADHGSGRFDGLPGVWRRSIGAAVAAAVEDGHRRLDHLATLGRLAVVGVEDPSTLADVDGPADLDRRPG